MKKLSVAEKFYIEYHVNKIAVADIALQLDLDEAIVMAYIGKIPKSKGAYIHKNGVTASTPESSAKGDVSKKKSDYKHFDHCIYRPKGDK